MIEKLCVGSAKKSLDGSQKSTKKSARIEKILNQNTARLYVAKVNESSN